MVLQPQSLKSLGLLTLLACSVVACGEGESESPLEINSTPTVVDRSLYLAPNPTSSLAFDRSSSDPNLLEPVNRILALGDYNQLVEPLYSQDRTRVENLIIGIGLEAAYQTRDANNQIVSLNLPIRMGIRARQWNSTTKKFGAETRIFKAQGLSLDGAIEFAITDPVNPNIVLTGLGFKLREGQFTKLELKRASIVDVSNQSFGSSFGNLTARSTVELPAGWAAVGLMIAVDKANATQPPRHPFVSDFLIYTANVPNAGN